MNQQTQKFLNNVARHDHLLAMDKAGHVPELMVGNIVYANNDIFGTLRYTIEEIRIRDDITYDAASYSHPIGDYPGELLDTIEFRKKDLYQTIFPTAKEADGKPYHTN